MPKSRQSKRKPGKKVQTDQSAPSPSLRKKEPFAWPKSLRNVWKIVSGVLLLHGLYSLIKDSLIAGRWALAIVTDLNIPQGFAHALQTGLDAAVGVYRSVVWPLFSWLDASLRDFTFVLVMIYGPTLVAGIIGTWRTYRGHDGVATFKAASNRQFYLQCVASVLLGIRALDDPQAYFYVTAGLLLLTPLQFIRHLDYRLPGAYGFKEARDTAFWYLLAVGLPYFFGLYPLLKRAPHMSATFLIAAAGAMLIASLALTLRDRLKKLRH